MKRKLINVMIGALVAMVLGMAGCGGGSSTPSTTPGNVTPKTVTGTASEGALILGKTVKLKDANGKSAVDGTTNATTGIYSIDVTDLTAPFLVTVTGTNGTYVSIAGTAGTANINPITTTVVALAAGNSDVTGLFTSLTPVQLTAINNNYVAKAALVTASLQAALPSGITATNYFTGTITAGTGMDAVFDTYTIAVNPTSGITVKTNDASATTVLTIPVATVTANTTEPLPTIIVPASPTGTPSLVGSWYVPSPNGGQAKGPIVITFIDGSNFMMAHDGDIVSDPSGKPGIERGTYTWNQTTGAFTAHVIVDTNGDWGFASPANPVANMTITVSADGNTLSASGAGFAFTKILKSSSNPLIGSWYVPSPNGGQAKGPIVITFIDGSNFIMAHDGDIVSDPSGKPGIERGTYTWNQATGAFTGHVIVDTNGDWGFASPANPVANMTITVSADGNTLSAAGAGFVFSRVQ